MGREMILGPGIVGEAPASDPALAIEGRADGEGSDRMLALGFDPPSAVVRLDGEHEMQKAQIERAVHSEASRWVPGTGPDGLTSAAAPHPRISQRPSATVPPVVAQPRTPCSLAACGSPIRRRSQGSEGTFRVVARPAERSVARW